MQKTQLNDQVSIVMRKLVSKSLNAEIAIVQQFIAQDKAYNFMPSIKSTPKKILFQVLAMVNQLGIPTFV